MKNRSVRRTVRLAINRIGGLTKDELCEIYDKLNRWGWDERIGEKPEGWDEMHYWKIGLWPERTRDNYLRPICERITEIVSEKELLRYHHIHNLHRTNEEFEMWWENSRGLKKQT